MDRGGGTGTAGGGAVGSATGAAIAEPAAAIESIITITVIPSVPSPALKSSRTAAGCGLPRRRSRSPE
ncbi:MAG TPA: hypothetical protein VIJ22_15140 [Polyangiaceae bacterium]